MRNLNWKFITLILLLVFSMTTCSDENIPSEIHFYFYDFETDYTNLDSIYVSEFDGDKVMGPFNNDGFSMHWEDLPKHDFVKLTFDLYIHDTWEGNTNGLNNGLPDHDAWFIEFDPHLNLKPHEKIYFETTFSNGGCFPGYCLAQSYPNQYPFYNKAKEGATKFLKGRCIYSDSPFGSTMYKIEKVFPHTNREMVVSFYDQLKQQGTFPHLCEESWSMDNLSISFIKN